MEALRSQANRQNAILNAAITEVASLDESGGYAMRYMLGSRAGRRIKREGQQSVVEESERNLEDIRRDIEEKAREATLPKDADGNPVPPVDPSEAPAFETADPLPPSPESTEAPPSAETIPIELSPPADVPPVAADSPVLTAEPSGVDLYV